jgi:hypothetical protein
MTSAQRHLVRVERAARLLLAKDLPTLQELIDIPYSVAFNAAQMVNSTLYDETQRDEFARNTAAALIRIEKEISTNPESANKYFLPINGNQQKQQNQEKSCLRIT